MHPVWHATPIILALLVSQACLGASFTDTFGTDPSTPDRVPFVWDNYYPVPGPQAIWSCADGALKFHANEARASGISLTLFGAGLEIQDATDLSFEVGFRHVSGTAPRPGYEVLCYLTWFAETPGQMRILALMYDAEPGELVFLNGSAMSRVKADLSGDFHPVRLTVEKGQVQAYLDGKCVFELQPSRAISYGQDPAVYIGPITGGEAVSVEYEFDYLALTTDGAFAPGAQPGWEPSQHTEPVAQGLKRETLMQAIDNPPYPGIEVISREKGSAAWSAATPEHWRRMGAINSALPDTISADCYSYPDEPAPSKQNIYRNSQPFRYDDKRCIAISHLTRGIDDTSEGFIDYKLWYQVSTDGGQSYDEARPLVQTGDGYSPMRPNQYVWIGKNGFCYGAIPPFLKLSNGEVLLPFYYAPLDAEGKYYNPVGAYTFTYVASLIGRWNAAGDDLIWECSEPVELTGEQSSRGSNEMAAIELTTPGHILFVMRGSNQPNPTGKLPATKWKALSTDYGRTWTDCTPFTYDDGTEFWSPSSCSSFIRSTKTGKAYWIGNISRTLPQGNSPRYPLIIGELDEEKLALRRETVTIIDDRRPGDPPDMELSNFNLIEDPQTQNIIVTVSRWMRTEFAGSPNYGTHNYVIGVK